MPEDGKIPDTTAALRALQAAARRVVVARHLEAGAEQELLQTIVNATVVLFDAEAASIALFEPAPDRLEFRVAAGPRGAGAVGLSVAPTHGIAGYVFSTGQPLALSDVASDPRFDRATAERTGYVPRSVAAVPLLDRRGSVGVLQVLDKRGSTSFSLRDMELLAVFAAQAAAAIRASRVQRDAQQLVRQVLGRLDDEADDEALDRLASEIAASLDDDESAPLWRLADRVATLRSLSEREIALVADMLEVVAKHAVRRRPSE